MQTELNLNDICRFCLNNKSNGKFKIFFEITEDRKVKFEEVTQKILPISKLYPSNICSECSDQLENFHFYKNQLIRKQEELEHYLKAYRKVEEENVDYQPATSNEIFSGSFIVAEEISSDIVYVEEDEQSVEETFSQTISENETENFEDVEETTNVDDAKVEDYSNYEVLEAEICEEIPKPKQNVPRLEEVKYDEVTPSLVLTPNFLKAREALKTVPKDNLELTDYISATLVSDSGEQAVFICSNSKCKAEFSSEEEMKLHLNDHKFDNEQQCEYCSMKFKTRHFYEKHIKTHTSYTFQFVCQVCGKVFDTSVQYRSHLRNHDKTRKYQCTFEGCEKAFRVKHHLINHLRVHMKDSPFACTIEGCKARFRQKHALTIHLRKHTGECKYCDNCKSPFVTQFLLNKHLEKCDGTYKPLITRISNNKKSFESTEFKCPIDDCTESYKAKISLEKHLTNGHQIVVTPTMCILCCHEFDSPQSLKSHSRDHLPFSCGLCSLNFKTEANLSNHLARSHEKDEVRLHGCQQCSAAFKRAEHLKSHVNYKHSTTDRPYSCDCCSYKSQTRQDMNSHMRTHLKSKDFTCRLCNFATSKLGNIKSHLKTVHNTEEYYYCYICSQSFKYNQEFTQHQKQCY